MGLRNGPLFCFLCDSCFQVISTDSYCSAASYLQHPKMFLLHTKMWRVNNVAVVIVDIFQVLELYKIIGQLRMNCKDAYI